MPARSDGTPMLVEYIAPAITPFSGNNPSFRVFTYNTSTYELLDYTQYYTNISALQGLPPLPEV
jgi:hypothetical protein